MAKSCNFPTFPRPLPLLYLHVQVLEWAQRILAAGEAFSGVECSSLRSMLTAQSSNFFNAYHSSNLEALHSMLEKELWRRLPSFGEGMGLGFRVASLVVWWPSSPGKPISYDQIIS